MADTTRASKLQFFFFVVPGPFFFTQVRQVKVVFLRTLRNAATRLSQQLTATDQSMNGLDELQTVKWIGPRMILNVGISDDARLSSEPIERMHVNVIPR